MRTYLVAIVANNEQEVIDFLITSPNGPQAPDSGIDCWWIAEDDRHDGSDNDSAIFVPQGSQADMATLVRVWIASNLDLWLERGYPYATTDVAGGWWPPRIDQWPNGYRGRHRAGDTTHWWEVH
jgi:hypothetical protein